MGLDFFPGVSDRSAMPVPLKPTDALWAGYIDAKPEFFDFSEGWCETWDFYAAERIQVPAEEFNDGDATCTCGSPVGYFAGELHHMTDNEDDDGPAFVIDVDQDEICDPELELDQHNVRLLEVRGDTIVFAVIGTGGSTEAFGHEVTPGGPMMNYRYPVNLHQVGDEQDAAIALIDLPVVLVVFGDEYYLALSGGGMDLSWEVCEAYMRLGYLPPLHFADLPGMAGKSGETDEAIVAACKATCDAVAAKAQRTKARLDELIREGN